MLTRVAARRYSEGDMQFAESLAADATKLYETLLARSDDPDLKFRAANALVQVAHIQIRMGEHEKAQQAYGRASQLLTPLSRDFPDREDYLDALAIVESGRGEALFSLERHADAEGPYRRALAVAEKLARQDKNNVARQIALADRLNNLGAVLTLTTSGTKRNSISSGVRKPRNSFQSNASNPLPASIGKPAC
jgi:tetratricopeptide (TPR) repeat protein